jgi:hypothetical protein
MQNSKLLSVLTLATAGLAMCSAAQAGVIDQSTTASAEFAQVYHNGTSVNLTIEGAGANRVVNLSTYSYTYGVGGVYWSGEIPADAVVDNGIASITVNVDTCMSTPRVTYGENACGLVNVTFTKNDYLWKTNGVTRYNWGDIIYEVIGGISTFSAAATGTVHGVDVSATNAYMGKYNDVSVTVSTAN